MKFIIDENYSQPDPYVIFSQDEYFMYVTGAEGVEVYRSKDFKNWKRVGICYQNDKEKDYWAPAVIELNNEYYLYFSSMPKDVVDTHNQSIKVAKSSSPIGPFVFVNNLLPPFSIDPHVIQSGNDLYIFYSENVYQGVDRVGTVVALREMKSPTEVYEEKRIVVRPSLDEEIFMRDRFKKGEHWHTIEGPFYFRKDNDHFLLYSGNCYENENYFIGYSYAQGDTDNLLDLSFEKYPNDYTYAPLIRKNEFEEGTGHNSMIEKDGKIYIIYHGRDLKRIENGRDQRTARYAEAIIKNHQMIIVKR